MKKNIPATPQYLNFLKEAESIDDLGIWLGGATVTGTYEFKLGEDESILLTDEDTTNFVAPDLAATENGKFKFLRTSDHKFLCQKEE